jgi:glycine cleavage system aminomethyltransferase T
MKTSPLHDTFEAQGATFGDWNGGVVPRRFGALQAEVDAARAEGVIVDLSPLGVLELEGADTPRFCNSMFTNNIRDLQDGGGNHNALTDKQGRIFGMLDAYLIRRDLLLAVVLYPLTSPALLAGAVATRDVYDNKLGDLSQWLRLLLAYDAIVLVAGLGLMDWMLAD